MAGTTAAEITAEASHVYGRLGQGGNLALTTKPFYWGDADAADSGTALTGGWYGFFPIEEAGAGLATTKNITMDV